MASGFGMCIYKFKEKPKDCSFPVGKTLKCSALGWELINCFMVHYGNKLSPDAGIRLIEEFCHLVLGNNAKEGE